MQPGYRPKGQDTNVLPRKAGSPNRASDGRTKRSEKKIMNENVKPLREKIMVKEQKKKRDGL